MGTHADTLAWLQHQLKELERWRADMMREAVDEQASVLERIDAHRNWLEAELSKLGAQPLEQSYS